jgi:hypothetical protein
MTRSILPSADDQQHMLNEPPERRICTPPVHWPVPEPTPKPKKRVSVLSLLFWSVLFVLLVGIGLGAVRMLLAAIYIVAHWLLFGVALDPHARLALADYADGGDDISLLLLWKWGQVQISLSGGNVPTATVQAIRFSS